jgi:hypothetical protein
MSHIHFCCHCSKALQGTALKCGGCFTSWYCNSTCQGKDWPNHKTTCKTETKNKMERELLAIVAARLGVDITNYPYEHFQGFMKTRLDASRLTTQEWMEDWFTSWDNENWERKDMLRGLFKSAGLAWSPDAYALYIQWSADRSGNRFEKMSEFIKMSRSLF